MAVNFWFIFVSNTTGALTIGELDAQRWALSQGVQAQANNLDSLLPSFIDEDDAGYLQKVIDYESAPKATVTSQTTKHHRNPLIASNALQRASYNCEVDEKHSTFISKSGKPFVEAHHLIPISATARLGLNLDFEENILSLCPNCHRAIHHSELGLRAALVSM